MKRFFETLVDLARERVHENADRRAYLYLEGGEREGPELGYGALDVRARQIAAALHDAGLSGRPVLLLYPPGLDFITAFFGCQYAGAIAVPAYPPDPARLSRTLARLQAIAADADAGAVLTTDGLLAMAQVVLTQAPVLARLRWLASDAMSGGGEAWTRPAITADSIALLQYTSGSTGTPRGVVLTHRNLLHNQSLIQAAFGVDDRSVVVGWLPLYHDMGLIGNVLHTLYRGASCVLMSPLDCLQRPARWLQAITRYRGTTSGGPNFIYDLCVRKVSDAERAGLDLGSWVAALDGAEPVRAETMERFAERFAPVGFRRDAFRPCYGLAEASLVVAGAGPEGARAIAIEGAALERGEVRTASGPGARRIAGSGAPLGDQRVEIVDVATGEVCAPGRVGEIWIAGASIAQGYWRDPEGTAASFGARLASAPGASFLRTGDLGFLHDGELFVTGRLKDVIIVRGRNHYPQDLERTAEASHPALRPGCGAAFAVDGERGEAVVVVHEIDARRADEAPVALAAIRAALLRDHDLAALAVVLVSPGTVPKTSSGKLQRRACRAAFLAGELAPVATWQTPGDTDEVVDDAARSAAGEASRAAELCALVARQLRIPPGELRGDQPLIEHGLDSMAALELCGELDAAFGSVVTLETLLGGVTLDQLAARCAAGAPRDGSPRPTLSAATGPAPLSPGQEALWFLAELAPDSAAYNVAGAAVIRGALDPGVLKRCFHQLVARHAALRTAFPAPAGRPIQHVLPADTLDWRELDGRGWDAATLADVLGEEADRPFQIRTAPLFRVRLVERAADRVLLLAAHHAAVDLWSSAVLLRELGVLYAAAVAGQPAGLAPLALEPADVARWQVAAQGADEAQHLAYWRTALAGIPAALDLPTDRRRPAVQTYRGAVARHTLPAALAARLRELARAQGTTLYTVLLAGFQALLHRYSRQADLVVGTSVAGRAHPELHGLVGYFVNPVAIRSRLAPAARFDELLGQTRRRVLEGIEHQAFPFPLLVERLQPERDPGRSPVFQVYFSFQDVPFDTRLEHLALGWSGPPVALGPLSLEPIELPRCVAQFDLNLLVAGLDRGELGCALQYNTDLFEPDSAAQLLRHLAALLEAAAADPAGRVRELPLLDGEARARLVAGPRREPPASLPLHRRFEDQVRRTPDAPAVTSGDATWSYAELDGHANRIAAALRAAGVGPEVPVALCLPRSRELVAGVIGILKAGGAYVPLDPSYPPDRLAYMLSDSGARVAVSDTERAALLAGRGVHVVAIDALSAAPVRAPDVEVRLEQLAYVLYTSGSTGRPKGSMVCHAQVTRLLDSTAHWFRFGPDDVWTLFHSICFDVSVWEIWGALLHGGRLVVVSHYDSRSPRDLRAVLVRERVTVLCQTPSAFRPLSAVDATADPRELALRAIIFAGEALELENLRGWFDRHGDQQPVIVNMYGITETTVHVTYRVIRRADLALRTSVIGDPIPDLGIQLLDDELEPVPVGMPGEIYVTGAGLARGYHDRPALTAERFVPDPHGPPGSRRYRSGDLARRTRDGELEYLGRLDDQVKIRGFRIELGEIEAALLRHPGVAEARVVMRDEAAGGGKRLVAYTVARAPHAPVPDELRGFLSAALPEYMLPAVVVMPALPLTPNGKLDVRALPAPEHVSRPGAGEPPADELEHQLAAAWAELLGLDRIGATDNFFTLGGHSLLAAELVARLTARLGCDVQLRDLFEAPTVRQLAATLRRRGATAGPSLPLAPVDHGGAVPLSDAQRRLWFLSELDPGSPAYNLPAALRLVGPLDAGALDRSLAEIERRHAPLRTRLAIEEGEVVQRFDDRPAPLVRLDVRAADDPEADALRLAGADAARGFDLSGGPPWRAWLIRFADERHLLVIVMHHIAFDGWSLGVLARELSALYAAFAAGEPSPLPPLAVEYADYAVWHRRWLASGVLDAQLAHWTRRLAGAPAVLELPTDHPRPAQPSWRGARCAVAIAPAATAALEQLCRREGATLAIGLQAVFALLLARHAGQDELIVGVPIAGRVRPELGALIGMFVNTLALRVDLAGDPTFRELVVRVRDAALDAYAHADVPFDRVVEAVRSGHDRSRAPLVQAVCALEPAVVMPRLPGLDVTLVPLDAGTAKFELVLTLAPAGGGLAGTLEYSTDLFEAATVANLARRFAALLEAAATAPERATSALSAMTAEERAIIAASNATAQGGPSGRIETWFEEQARRTPSAIALAWDGGALGYAELDRRGDAIAHRLRALGVVPGARVGLCMERSAALVISMIGTLKAGATYAPLDPSAPRERLLRLLGELEAPVVITQPGIEDRVAGPGRQLIVLGDARDAGDPGAPAPANRGGSEVPAYVIYTSGSTGRPKGVVVGHRAAGNFIAWYARRLGLGPGDRAAWTASVVFDVSVTEVWSALASGTTLVLPPDDIRLDPERLLRWLADQRITAAFVSTPLVESMLGLALPPALTLRTLVTGGSRLSIRPPPVAGFELVNAYGPTECAIFCTTAVVEPGRAEPPPIGGPIANIQAYVVDRQLREVPPGVPGELVIGGVGLADGYLAQPAITAAGFVPDPFSGVPGARLYRTGDVVRRRPDGTLDYLGRRDAQVKLRGHRVELGEIEYALRAQPGVAAAAVRLWNDAGDDALVAYVVWTGEGAAEPVLCTALADQLPAYMVPAAVVELAALPLTANGKPDTAALPAPPRRAGGGARPQTREEVAVAAVFGEVLRADQVGRDDDFFELGGHSLAAMRVIALVRDRLGADLELRALFEAPTVAGLARCAAAAPPVRAGAPADEGAAYPLSSAQQRLWFIDRLGHAGAAYHMAAAFRLRGPLARDALVASLEALVRCHDALRVRFADGQQVIGPPVFQISDTDLAAVDPAARDAAARSIVVDEAHRPFDLEAGPAIRALLVRLQPDDHVLCLVAHHLVADGLSVARLFDQLAAAYRAALRGVPPALDPPRTRYADFVAWQQSWLSGPAFASELAHWRQALAGAPTAIDLPTDRPRPEVKSSRGEVVAFALDAALLDRLCVLARDEGATPFMALLGAFAALLARHAWQDDLLIGSPVAGRPLPEFEPVVGLFAETLVLRVTLDGRPSFRRLLRRVRATTLTALAHAALPFDRLVEELRPPRDLSRSPLVQVMFTYHDGLAALPELAGLTTAPWPVELGTTQFDLVLGVERRPDGARCTLEYSTELFEPATAERLARQLPRLIADAVARPDAPVAELAVVDAPERTALLALARGPHCDAGGDVLESFWRCAARTPDALAVAGSDEQLSYCELAEHAARLAHHLRTLGVACDRPAGVYLERGAGAVVAVLAILEAGGAYVPLDPAWPVERTRFALRDAGACCVVSRGALIDALGELPCPAVVLDRDAAAIAAQPAARLASDTPAGALAYIIYTSGSTGRPKGVAVSRAGLAASTAARRVYYRAPVRAYLLLSSLSFDSSVAGLFWTLGDGGALVVPPDAAWGDPAALGALIERHGVSHLLAIPGLYHELLTRLSAPAVAPLQVAIVAGEACPAALVERHTAALPAVALYNEYGPTEATVWSTVHACSDAPSGRVPIGAPIPGAAVYVLDDDLEPVPRGGIGQIFVGGPGVARGYVGRPGLTAERFVPDPHGAPGSRLYRTGDLARIDRDGAIEFLGRTDHQVKLRGFRIELEEIEARLRDVDGVADAAVAVHEVAPGDLRLVAYLAGAQPSDEAIRAALRAHLPASWMPAHWIRLAALPRTPSGKLDRRQLPPPTGEPGARGDAVAYVAPGAGLERAIAEIWCDALKLDRVGTRDNFFDLGGHSLLLFHVQRALRERLARDVAIVELFRYPTVESLAAALDAAPPAGEPAVARAGERERGAARLQHLAHRRRDRR